MKLIGLLLIVELLVAPVVTSAQTTDADAWRTLAGNIAAGSAIDVRLRDGRHFKATFIAAQPDGMLMQRKTRIPVAVEQIGYEAVASMWQVQGSSLSGAKIAGIALGSAGAAIATVFLILLATID